MSTAITWPQVSELLEDAKDLAAIDASFPQAQRISFLTALEEVDSASTLTIRDIGRRLTVASQLANYPIIAVAGMLNSGKTSLVASFLNTDGRQRSLRGESNREGTHRFVLWLPESWREDADVWGLLMSRLGESLGRPPEMLSTDPHEAHQQYNNSIGEADALAVPLVATDHALDSAGVGLLDCPDIVTSESFGKGAVETRRELLTRAAALCSAFVIVTDFSSIRARTVGTLLDIAAQSMPGVNRYLAVNRIRPKYPPHEVAEDIKPLIESHGIAASYLAYDFEIADSEAYTPKVAERGDASDPLPAFFETPDHSHAIDFRELSANKLLNSLPAQLDQSDLFAGFLRSQEASLTEAVWHRGMDPIRKHIDDSHACAQRSQQSICDCALDFFARRNPDGTIAELRLHQSPHIIDQLTSAFSEAAPWYARLSMKMNGFVSRITHRAGDLIRGLQLSAAAQAKAAEIRDKLRQGSHGSVLTGIRLCEAMTQHDVPGQMRTDIPREDLLQKCESIAARFNEEDDTVLDADQLRKTAESMWSELSLVKKLQHGLSPLAALIASFAAVLMVPVDGGGSLIVMHASIAELLIAAGFTGLVTAWNSHGSIRTMELQAARQQLSEFVAISCDVLGVPRCDHQHAGNIETKNCVSFQVAGKEVSLPTADATPRPLADPPIHVWQVRTEFEAELHRRLPRDERS